MPKMVTCQNVNSKCLTLARFVALHNGNFLSEEYRMFNLLIRYILRGKVGLGAGCGENVIQTEILEEIRFKDVALT